TQRLVKREPVGCADPQPVRTIHQQCLDLLTRQRMGIAGSNLIRPHFSGARYVHEPIVRSNPKLAAIVRQKRIDLQVRRSTRGKPLAQRLSFDSTCRRIEAIESSLCTQPDASLGVLRDRQNGIAAERRGITCNAAKSARSCPVNHDEAVVACRYAKAPVTIDEQ